MLSEEARLASFAGASSSSSSTKKRQTRGGGAPQWPHPTTGRSVKSSGIPTPSILAKHGFFYAGSEEAHDAVCHFLYPGVVLSQWQSGDDPLAKLEEAVPGNGWCRIFRSLQESVQDPVDGRDDMPRWSWSRADLLPTSKEMIDARKETFASHWPYDGKKGWKPTSKRLAEAGFYFTPTDEEEDSATCVYCKKSLGGWEKGDDPTHEHQKREPQCPFFNAVLLEPATKESAKTADEEDVEDENEAALKMPKRGKRAVSTHANARKASTRTVAKGRSTRKIAEQDQDGQEESDAGQDQEQDKAGSDVLAAAPSETDVASESDHHEGAVTAKPKAAAAKKAARKTRTVSSKMAASEPEPEPEPRPQPESEAEPESRPATKSLDKSTEPASEASSSGSQSTALGHGSSKPARSVRAASRRATKAIEALAADDDINNIPRRPDPPVDAKKTKRMQSQQQHAYTDPIPFPSSEPDNVPATDPIVPTQAKPKRSRSKGKKLNEPVKEPTPEPEPEPEPLLDEIEVEADNTVIEHPDSDLELEEEAELQPDVESEPEPEPEKPKRRGGGRTTKASSAAAASAASTIASSDALSMPPPLPTKTTTTTTTKAAGKSRKAASSAKTVSSSAGDAATESSEVVESEPDAGIIVEIPANPTEDEKVEDQDMQDDAEQPPTKPTRSASSRSVTSSSKSSSSRPASKASTTTVKKSKSTSKSKAKSIASATVVAPSSELEPLPFDSSDDEDEGGRGGPQPEPESAPEQESQSESVVPAEARLTNASSQATIRATSPGLFSTAPISSLGRSQLPASSSSSATDTDQHVPGRGRPKEGTRTPLAQLSQLSELRLDDKDRKLSLGHWLQLQADKAAAEMRVKGSNDLEDLENQLASARIAVERALRGRS
ncbi:hypothetical protein BCV70DRAFT_199543 [Testicularia cyperi]|uniref:BIR-domain-containing protein n=1 Tax=Testicularia cyperi TaxID=1882483 RepID=A0A317XTR1_9BASI|nr:hypothetical protein BCV70DRAFT_199543 [Testicularia cyperi]